MSGTLSLLAFASGRVQGVGYRAFVQRAARRLGVVGHARNLPDGRVEMLLCGEGAAVQSVLDEARKGPPLADVAGLEVAETACEAPKGFTTS